MKKLIMQFDAYYGDYSNSDPQELVKVLFYNIDHGHAKPEIILWETHPFLPDECPENNTKECNTFCARGIDMMRILIDETKKRGIKAYFHYRISEVDKGFRKNPPEWNSVKREHPDWCIKSWYWQGTWNLASEALQKFKLNYLEQILREYEFDGICVDFLRHLPCLPLGKQ